MGNPAEAEQEARLPLSKKVQVLCTAAIFFQNVAFGAAMNFYSPALEDLRAKYDSTVDEISIVFTIMLIAYCCGALTSGFVYNWVNRQLAIIIYFFGMGAGLFISPHCPTLTTFFVTGYFIGYFVGAYDAAQVVWMMEIWQSKAGPFIQAQHFCYALGSNLPPLLLGPFLVNKDDDEEDAIDVGISTTDISIASSTMEAEKESKIFIPFTIGGAYCCLSALVQIFLFTFYRYHTPPVEEDLDSDNNIVPAVETQDTIVTSEEKAGFFKNVNWSKVKMIVFSAMFYGGYQGMEMCSFQFIPTFGQYSNLKLSESNAAFVLTGLTGAFAVGRFLGIFIIMKIPPLFILCANLGLVLIGNIILLIWANDNLTMLWTGCIVLGAGFSTMYASYAAFMERHLVVTNFIGSFMIVVGSTVAAIYPLIVGGIIEEKVVVLTYTNFFSIAVCTTALLIIYKLTHHSTERMR